MFKKFQLIKMFALIFEGYELNIVSQILGLRIILFNLLFLQRHCFEILANLDARVNNSTEEHPIRII